MMLPSAVTPALHRISRKHGLGDVVGVLVLPGKDKGRVLEVTMEKDDERHTQLAWLSGDQKTLRFLGDTRIY